MGVKVSNASGYSTVAVAELTLAMMLDLLRNVPQIDAACRRGQTKAGLIGGELEGKNSSHLRHWSYRHQSRSIGTRIRSPRYCL